MEGTGNGNNNFLLNLHPGRQSSVTEANANTGKSASNTHVPSYKNNNSASVGSKNIFSTLGKSHSSNILNTTTSAINKNITSFLSGSTNHSTTSLPAVSQTSKNQSSSVQGTVSNHHNQTGSEPNIQIASKGTTTLSRTRSFTGGSFKATPSVHSLPSVSTMKKKHSISKTPLNVANIFKRTEVIGRGKFGVVYKGYHIKTKHIYAIKVLNLDSNEDEIEDVQKEIKFLSSSKNIANVTKYYGSYLNDTKLWIIMEYCAGGSLRTLLRAGVLDDKSMSVIFRELLLALSAIHNDKVIHRDIKAANILIGQDGKVKLCDFGVAAKLSQTRPRRQSLAGTPFWMAPEVITESASYNSKADIWSLGITVYEAATGNPPYCDVDAMRAMQMIVKNKPPRLEGKQYSQSLKEFVALCLDENPYERPTADILLKSNFIAQYSSVKVSHLKELIIRYHNYKIKNKNNMSSVDTEPSSLNKEENVKANKTKSSSNLSAGNSNLAKKSADHIISSSNAVNIPSTPMPLAPSMGERTFSDAFGAAALKNKLKQHDSDKSSLRVDPLENIAPGFVDKDVQQGVAEDSKGDIVEENPDETIQWDFDSIEKSELNIKTNSKTPYLTLFKNNYKTDLNEDQYWDEEKHNYQYITEDERQTNTHNMVSTTMTRNFLHFNTQSAAPASVMNSYHPQQSTTFNKSYQMLQTTVPTANLKYQNTYNTANNLNPNNNFQSGTNLLGTAKTGNLTSSKMDGNSKYNNTRAFSLTGKKDKSESTFSHKPMHAAIKPPQNLLKLFEDLDTRPPNELELPIMTPAPLQDSYGNEPKSYFENVSSSSRTDNYAMYMLKNKKYLQDGKNNSNLSLNTDSPGISLTETNVIEIPDELPVVTTPSMASIPTQIKTRSRSSTLNAVLTKNANAVANNLEIQRRGTISTGYLKNPIAPNYQPNSLNDAENASDFNNDPVSKKKSNLEFSGSRLSPVKLDLKVNTSNSDALHNPVDLLEGGVGRISPSGSHQVRVSSPNQIGTFSSEPISAMTPASSFVPSPKRKRNLSMVGGQTKPVLGDTKNNTDIMNSLLQPFNDVNRSAEHKDSNTLNTGEEHSTNQRLIRDFKRNNPHLKLEMPLPNNNLKSASQTGDSFSQGININTPKNDENSDPQQTTGVINQFGFNLETTSNITIAMTPLAEKPMLFSSTDIKKSEEHNLSGILEENVIDEEDTKLATPALTPGLVSQSDYNNALERKAADVNYFAAASVTNISEMNKLDSGIKSVRDVLNSDDLKNNINQSATNLDKKVLNMVMGSSTNLNNVFSNNISVINNSGSPLNQNTDSKEENHNEMEPVAVSKSPLAMMSSSSAHSGSNMDSNENFAPANNKLHSQENFSNIPAISTNIINPRISSRIRSTSNANSSSTVATPKIDEFADMRIMLLDYPALKENEVSTSRNAVLDSSAVLAEEADEELHLNTSSKPESNAVLDDDVNVTDLRDFLEEERDHYYYYALEQEQRDMLMSDLKALIVDYEKSFSMLEHEFKIFDESLE